MAQVSATVLPLPRLPDPKASEMKRPCWQALRHWLGLLCQGRHAGASASLSAVGLAKSRIMTPIFNYPHSRAASQWACGFQSSQLV